MRTAGKPEFNPATASQANYATLHNGAHLNVVMQITLDTFFYGSESQPCWEELEHITRMKHLIFFFLEVEIHSAMKDALECLQSSKQAEERVFSPFYLAERKKKSVINYAATTDDPRIQMESSKIDNYRRWAR